KTIAFKNSEIRFKLGEEFEEKRLDGAVVKTVVNLEGGKLVQKQHGDKEVTITREVDGDTLKVVCESNAVVSTRVYKRV
ncbi:lipocalin/fatty-acid binding family protein, partial [Acinetobacter baumannii]|uniref:lipocalin/fatty-acid binding family protein n=1 Tax=Acinetobacter baumannii TaxID=470 RepID=UPI0011140FEE